MGWLSGPFVIAAAVLAVGGAFKLRDTEPTRAMLADLQIPAPARLARLVGPTELVLGSWGLLAGSRWPAAAVGAAYGVVSGLVAAQLRAGRSGSCGCFGRLSAPPSAVHLGTSIVAGTTAVATAVADAPGLITLVADAGPAGGPLLVAMAALGSALVIAVLTVLPQTLELTRHGRSWPATVTFHLRPDARSVPNGAISTKGMNT